jgi:RNA ligase (TIGR02306 family)
MAGWRVAAERIRLQPHPKSDRLMVGKLGLFQVVVRKDAGYVDGQVVVFAPRRSLLPPDLQSHYVNARTGESYLAGDGRDRVTHVRMAGQLSEGVVIPPEYVAAKLGLASVEDAPVGRDLSAALGIARWRPAYPPELQGATFEIDIDLPYRRHDVERHSLFGRELRPGEPVVATEKVHGVQAAAALLPDGRRILTSKGLAEDGLAFVEDCETCGHWRGARNSRLFERLGESFPGRYVQAFGELVPTQRNGFNYGKRGGQPEILLYRVDVDAQRVPEREILEASPALAGLWVPVLYEGPYDLPALEALAGGMERVSGCGLHIREGIVIEPAVPRDSEDGFPLFLKLLNPDYKESDDDPS